MGHFASCPKAGGIVPLPQVISRIPHAQGAGCGLYSPALGAGCQPSTAQLGHSCLSSFGCAIPSGRMAGASRPTFLPEAGEMPSAAAYCERAGVVEARECQGGATRGTTPGGGKRGGSSSTSDDPPRFGRGKSGGLEGVRLRSPGGRQYSADEILDGLTRGSRKTLRSVRRRETPPRARPWRPQRPLKAYPASRHFPVLPATEGLRAPPRRRWSWSELRALRDPPPGEGKKRPHLADHVIVLPARPLRICLL